MRKEQIPPIRSRREFDSLGISECVDEPGVGSVRLGCEYRLHPVKRWVEHEVPDPNARERAGDDLGDRRPRALLERDIFGRAGDKLQDARLDEACAVIFPIDFWMVRTVLEVLQGTGGQASEVTLKLQPQGFHKGGICGEIYRLELHDHGDPIGRDISLDGKDFAGPVLVDALPNSKEGVQDRNEAVFVDGE